MIKSFVGQDSYIPLTEIFTPLVDGAYRVSVYLSTPDSYSSAPTPSIGGAITYTDDCGNAVSDSFVLSASKKSGSTGILQEVFMVGMKANTPLSVQTNQNGSNPSLSSYSLYIAVESLS